MMPAINIDTILSDPLLIVASVLLVVSPVVFLVAFVKFLRAPRNRDAFAIPEEDLSSPISSLEPLPKPEPVPQVTPVVPAAPPVAVAPPAAVAPPPPPPPPPPAPAAAPSPVMADAEKTVVLPAGVADIQAQLEIALTQIRTLNKKIYDLESRVSGGPNAGGDFAAKLQTLAEHVIVLEKEMARMKSGGPSTDVPPGGAERRPPMPL